MTKADILKLAQKKYGKRAMVSERKNASTATDRLVADERVRVINGLLAGNDAELKTLAGCHDALIKAARFVVDVDGDKPSIPAMWVPLQRCERHAAIIEQSRELRDEKRACSGAGVSYRWTVGVNESFYLLVKHQADTLEELAGMLASAQRSALI